MISEGIHDRLKEVYDEFDRHCRVNNIDYSIDADYYNVQAYRLLSHNDVGSVLQHMANYVKDKWVGLEYDGFLVNYDKLKSNNFDVPTYNPLFKFTLEAIQEEEEEEEKEDMPINEDIFKGPTNAHGRKQAAFPSSFRKLKTRDTYEGEGSSSGVKKKKKKKKKKKTKKESLDKSIPFGDRLLSSIKENVGLSIIEPDVLLVVGTPADQPEEESEEEALNDALQAESLALCKYLIILKKTGSEYRNAIVEGLADRCTKQINELNRLLKD